MIDFDEFFNRGSFDRLYYGSWVVTPKSEVSIPMKSEIILPQLKLADYFISDMEGISYVKL